MFVGLTDVSVGSATTRTMQFAITAATLHGMTTLSGCRSSVTVRSEVADPDTAVIGASTLYLTSISFTLSGSPQAFTVS